MGLIKPFKGRFRLTQSYGINPEAYKKFNLAGHNGTDWGLPVGTPLIAAISGVVVEVDFDRDGYGWYVKIENNEEGALVAHMSAVSVQVGFTVNQGDRLGLSGNTGNSTGPHVHFGYYIKPRDRKNGFNGYINPEIYLSESEDNMEQLVNWQNTTSGKLINTAPDYVEQLEKDRADFWKRLNELQKLSDSLVQKLDEVFKS